MKTTTLVNVKSGKSFIHLGIKYTKMSSATQNLVAVDAKREGCAVVLNNQGDIHVICNQAEAVVSVKSIRDCLCNAYVW